MQDILKVAMGHQSSAISTSVFSFPSKLPMEHHLRHRTRHPHPPQNLGAVLPLHFAMIPPLHPSHHRNRDPARGPRRCRSCLSRNDRGIFAAAGYQKTAAGV